MTLNTAVETEAIAQNTESIVIGMGEIHISNIQSTVLSCIGLGSCVAVCLYDRQAKVGGMVHVVLPRNNGTTNDNRAKFADSAVPLMLEKIRKKGGETKRLIAKIAGGAHMTIAPGLKNTFKTGEHNIAEVIAALEREGIPLKGNDTGGNRGRTVHMYLDTGRITVRIIGEATR